MTLHLPTGVGDLVDVLAGLRGAVAVVLGGSRASGAHDAASDWDLGLYYRGTIDRAVREGYERRHDHCIACGRTDHRARGGKCSPTYLAARDVMAGIPAATAARKHGLVSSGQLIRVVKRLRALDLRDAAPEARHG